MEFFSERFKKEKEFEERVVEVNRVSRTVAGGRRIRFRVAVVIGDKKGRVGIGVAKSNEVVDAVGKAIGRAKNKLINVPLQEGTIPHEIQIKYGGATVFLKPAAPGTGLIAGGAIRSVAELSGIKDLLSKSLGSENKINCLKATMIALESLKAPVVHDSPVVKRVEPYQNPKKHDPESNTVLAGGKKKIPKTPTTPALPLGALKPERTRAHPADFPIGISEPI